MLQRLAHALRQALGIAHSGAFPCEGVERGLRRRETLAQLFRIAMGQFVEAEGEAVEEADRLLDRRRRLGEQPRHLAGRFQAALGVGLDEAPSGFERHPFTDAG